MLQTKQCFKRSYNTGETFKLTTNIPGTYKKNVYIFKGESLWKRNKTSLKQLCFG